MPPMFVPNDWDQYWGERKTPESIVQTVWMSSKFFNGLTPCIANPEKENLFQSQFVSYLEF